MFNSFSRRSYPLWVAMETCPPHRVIGVYDSVGQAQERCFEFGSPAIVQEVGNLDAAYELVNQLRRIREGR